MNPSHAAPAPGATTTVPVADAVLAVDRFGDPSDPTVLLVAGTGCSRDWWPPALCSDLAATGRQVVRFDQRDTGAATHVAPGEATYGLPDLVTDAVAVLDAVDVERATWVGFSQGGWVAQLAALDHADRVAGLVLVASRPTGHGPADADLPEVTDALMAAWGSAAEPDWSDPASVVDALVDGERALAGPAFDAAHARTIATLAVDRSPDVRSADNHTQVDQGPRWRERLGTISAPTVVVHGAADPLFPPANGDALAASIPGAELVIVPGMGHELPRPAWPEIVAAVGVVCAQG